MQYDDIIGWLVSAVEARQSTHLAGPAQHTFRPFSISQSQAPLQKDAFTSTCAPPQQAHRQGAVPAGRKESASKHTVFQRDPNAGGCFTSTDSVGDEHSDCGEATEREDSLDPPLRGAGSWKS